MSTPRLQCRLRPLLGPLGLAVTGILLLLLAPPGRTLPGRLAGLLVVGMAAEGTNRRRRPSKSVATSGDHARFDQVPVQILEEDFTAVAAVFVRLRAAGVTDLGRHLATHPGLAAELQGLIRVRNANHPAVAAAGFARREELIAEYSRRAEAPHREVCHRQLTALWQRRRNFEDEFRYQDAQGRERACLMRCSVGRQGRRADLSRVVLVLVDTTTARRTVEARMENQEVMRQILARANILLWWARVHREGDRFRWTINVPAQSFDSPLYQLATAKDEGGLWDIEHAPELPETIRRAERAMHDGLGGYQQEFRVLSPAGVHWLNEDVAVHPLGPDEWSLLGVVTDVTARHEAEAARRASEEQLRQILTGADCLLWQATVERRGDDDLGWHDFEIPPSGLYTRLFGRSVPDASRGLWTPASTPQWEEMIARCGRAILSGAPGYEQEFPVRLGGRAFWLQERVSIAVTGKGSWRLTGVIMDTTARHAAEEALRASEARLRQLLEQADCLLWQARVRWDGQEIRWPEFDMPRSGLYLRLFSDRPVTMKGKLRLWSLLNVPEMPEMNQRVKEALLGGAPGYEQDFRVVKPEGTVWLHEHVSITPAGPAEWRLVGVLTDVTARHEAEAALQLGEERLRQIQDQADCLLWQARVVHRGDELEWDRFVVSESGLHRRLFGTPHHNSSRGLWQKPTVPELPEMDRRSREAILSGKSGYEQEFRFERPEGALWLLERVAITRSGPDEWALVGVAIDVTARREAEQARLATEAQLRQILKQADCIVWQARVVRVGGEFRWGDFQVPDSPLRQLVFGTEPRGLKDELWTLVHVPELAEMNQRSAAALETGASGYEHEFRVMQADRTLWLLERTSITRVGPDEWAVVGILIDVTARREAEEAHRASEARLRQILERANCMLWQGRVRRVDGKFRWTHYRVPASPLHQLIFGVEQHPTAERLWSLVNVPEQAEMDRRSAAALLAGEGGYDQEFRVVQPDRTIWLLERVTLDRIGPDEWSVAGVLVDVTERHRAEEARQKVEAQLQQIVERVDCVLWNARVTERDGRFVWAFELPRSGLQRQLFGDKALSGEVELYDGLDVPELPEMCRRSEAALRSGSSGYEQEFHVVKPDRTHWMHERVSITAEGPGSWLLFGVILDVSALKEAELARQRSEERLRQLLNGADCMLWQARVVENAAGGMDWQLYIPRSRLYRDLFGADPEERPNLMWSELNVPELAVMDARSTEALHRGRPGYEQEFHARRGERWYWLHEQVTIQPVASREWSLIGVITDISARRDAELALAAEKERLAVTLRAMSEGVITTDTHGVVQFINRAAAGLTGCDEAEAVGRPLDAVCPLHGSRAEDTVLLPFGRMVGQDTMIDLPPGARLRAPDGSERQIEGRFAPVHAADSALIGTVMVFRDVTEHERLEEEIARASKLESVGILAGGIAHDFNNILTVIMGNITLAMLDAQELARVEAYLRETERAALRARELTQQLLTFAKGGDPIRAAVRLPEVMAEVAEFALHGSRVKCEYDFEEQLWPADADKGQISRVVQNLVINAVQAMPEGGVIRLGAHNERAVDTARPPFRCGEFVHLSLADTGVGIQPEHLAKVFDPYFTTKQQGSGLGLATVYSIVKRHQGHIQVDSQPGRGTTFHIWLPASRELQMELPKAAEKGDVAFRGRVLLMDDETSIREMAGVLLGRLGFDVELAGDGAEAVARYREALDAGNRFDLVVVDLTVPGGMGGREAVERLREIDPGVKAIVSSGYSSDPVLAHYQNHGFRAMVAKPYQLDDLTRALQQALG